MKIISLFILKKKLMKIFQITFFELKNGTCKNLLKTSSKSISEISFLLGYEDYRSFNRVFKITEKTHQSSGSCITTQSN